MRKRRVLFGVAGFILLAGLVGTACSSSNSPGTNAGKFAGSGAPIAPVGGGAVSVGRAAGPVQGDVVRSQLGLPAIPQRIVKTAAVFVQVKVGSFDQQFQQATQVAARHGGFAESSSTAAGKFRSGTIVLRVPADQFETALGELKGLGKVESQRITGQDVTAQFVDLQARLRNWQSQEAVLLRLMSKSTSIEDSIKVQQQLQDVQLNIEEITGQLRVLSNQADLSTITLSMSEAGAVPPKPVVRSGLAKAWRDAVHGFVAVVAAVVVGVGYLLPVALLVLVGLLGWATFRRTRTRTGVAPTV